MNARTLALDDRGLELVLSGGLRWLEHAPGHEGATLVLRGPAGAGKTLCAVHLALALAKELGGDVAYACIELLPAELMAQARSLFGERRDVLLEEKAPPASWDGKPRLLAQLLELPDRAESLGDALTALWASTVWQERLGEGRRPRVLVIDSLIEGYGLGSSVSREFADAVCKLAASWNIALILVEEASPGTQSPWVYAADTVLELATSAAVASERQLTVLKHRFGPSNAGPHPFAFVEEKGLRVYPKPSAWLETWAVEEVRRSVGNTSAEREKIQLRAPDVGVLAATVVLVHGVDEHLLAASARSIQRVLPPRPDNRALELSFALPLEQRIEPANDRKFVFGCGHPYLGAARFLHAILEELRQRDEGRGVIRRVVVGNLASIRLCPDPDEILRAIGALCALMRACDVAVVLYESTEARMHFNSRGGVFFFEPGFSPPRAAAFADVVLNLFRTSTDGTSAQLTVRRAGP